MLFAVSVIGGQRALVAAGATTPVLVVAADLARGDLVEPEDLRIVQVRLPRDMAATYLDDPALVEGRVVARAVRVGEFLPEAALVDAQEAGGRSITVPVSPDHAVGGSLRPGDLVDVYVTFDAEDVRARTLLLVREAEILEAVSADGFVMGDQGMVGITLAVTPEEAGRLAFAIRTADIDLVRVDAPGGSSGSEVVTGADI